MVSLHFLVVSLAQDAKLCELGKYEHSYMYAGFL